MKFHILFQSMLLIALIVGLGFAAPVRPVYAATLVVNTLMDENDGSCLDGDCSLRDAVIAASASGDTITFSVTGTITLSALLGHIVLNKDLTITGPGSANLTISGNDASRIFLANTGKTISISGMTLTHGKPDPASGCSGGAIYNFAFLTLNDLVITNSDATLTDPSTCSYPRGGGIALFGSGSLTMTNSTVSNNKALAPGGGIYFASTTGTLSLTNVTISGNTSTDYYGGGLDVNQALGTVTLDRVKIYNNSGYSVAGLYIDKNGAGAATVTQIDIVDSYIYNNNNTSGDGNGISIYGAGTVNVTGSTIANNSSHDGGGIYVSDDNNVGTIVNITNSTIAGNSANASGKGGGIYVRADGVGMDPSVNIKNSTIAGNTAASGTGGIYAASGSTINLSNAILANNVDSSSTSEDCDGTINSQDYNLIEVLTGCTIAGTTTHNLNVDPVLGPLANNGGSTPTMALLAGSPAIDAGNDAVCTTVPVGSTSQNGVTRPIGSHCDIGSFELTIDASININMSGNLVDTYMLAPDNSQISKYTLDGGPVVISSNNGANIVASLDQWRRLSATTPWTGIAQSMAIPMELITNKYVMPRYVGNDPTLYNAILIANVDTVSRDITVTIGGTAINDTITLGPSASQFVVYAGVVGGPIVVSSAVGAKIVASLYELKRGTSNTTYNGQSEMNGLPFSQLSDTYLIPIYFGDPVHVGLSPRLFIANADVVSRDITVKIGGVPKGTYTLPPNTSQVLTYPVDGAVEVSGPPGSKIIASLDQWRRLSAIDPWTGIAQSMAIPTELITSTYVMPRYVNNDPTLYNAVLIANVDTVSRDITVTIGGTAINDTITLGPSESQYRVYAGVVGGPIVVSSATGAKIVASLYELKRGAANTGYNGQSEMNGLPFSQLSDTYLIPIYFGDPAHVGLDARLFIAVP